MDFVSSSVFIEPRRQRALLRMHTEGISILSEKEGQKMMVAQAKPYPSLLFAVWRCQHCGGTGSLLAEPKASIAKSVVIAHRHVKPECVKAVDFVHIVKGGA